MPFTFRLFYKSLYKTNVVIYSKNYRDFCLLHARRIARLPSTCTRRTMLAREKKQEAQKKFTNNTKDDYALFTLTLQFRSVRFCRRAIFSSFTWIVREHQYRLEVKSIISNPNIPYSVICRAGSRFWARTNGQPRRWTFNCTYDVPAILGHISPRLYRVIATLHLCTNILTRGPRWTTRKQGL